MERFEYVASLGEGAYGTVWLCRNRETGGKVAMKRFKEAHTDPEVMRLALREIKLLKASQHQNVVALLEAFRSKSGRVYIVMDYVEKTLTQELRRFNRGMPPLMVKLVTYQLLQAVSFLHHKRIVHRDLKPANILLTADQTVKICDFGFARTLHPKETADYTTYVVTRWYRPPEILVNDEYGPNVDVWAIGCLFCEMATGRPLFPGKTSLDQLQLTMKTLGPLPARQAALMANEPTYAGVVVPPAEERTPLEQRYPQLNSEMLDVAYACLALDPKQRYSADEVLAMPYFEDVPQVLNAMAEMQKSGQDFWGMVEQAWRMPPRTPAAAQQQQSAPAASASAASGTHPAAAVPPHVTGNFARVSMDSSCVMTPGSVASSRMTAPLAPAPDRLERRVDFARPSQPNSTALSRRSSGNLSESTTLTVLSGHSFYFGAQTPSGGGGHGSPVHPGLAALDAAAASASAASAVEISERLQGVVSGCGVSGAPGSSGVPGSGQSGATTPSGSGVLLSQRYRQTRSSFGRASLTHDCIHEEPASNTSLSSISIHHPVNGSHSGGGAQQQPQPPQHQHASYPQQPTYTRSRLSVTQATVSQQLPRSADACAAPHQHPVTAPVGSSSPSSVLSTPQHYQQQHHHLSSSGEPQGGGRGGGGTGAGVSGGAGIAAPSAGMAAPTPAGPPQQQHSASFNGRAPSSDLLVTIPGSIPGKVASGPGTGGNHYRGASSEHTSVTNAFRGSMDKGSESGGWLQQQQRYSNQSSANALVMLRAASVSTSSNLDMAVAETGGGSSAAARHRGTASASTTGTFQTVLGSRDGNQKADAAAGAAAAHGNGYTAGGVAHEGAGGMRGRAAEEHSQQAQAQQHQQHQQRQDQHQQAQAPKKKQGFFDKLGAKLEELFTKNASVSGSGSNGAHEGGLGKTSTAKGGKGGSQDKRYVGVVPVVADQEESY